MIIQIKNTLQENQLINCIRSGLIRTAERQETAPRLTEMVECNVIEIVGKKFDSMSNRNVAIYKRKKERKNENS